MHQLATYFRIIVCHVTLPLNLHEDEPVSEPELLHDDGDVVPVAGLGAATEH